MTTPAHFQELDPVKALQPIKAAGGDAAVRAGQVGTIVHIATHPSTAYLVEFADEQGRTLAMPFLRADQIERLATEPAPT